MQGYYANIEAETVENTNFRKVLYTGQHMQLVAMSLPPNGEIGQEIHTENDQFFRFEAGEGLVVIDGNEYQVGADDVVIVPSGAEHNVVNTSSEAELKLYTIYSPPHHKDGTVRATREEAEASEPAFDGVTSE